MKQSNATAPTVRTSVGLRDSLFAELDALRAGQSNPQRASAAAKLAVQIINAARLEVEYQRHVNSKGPGQMVAAAPVLLGSPD